MDVPTLKPNWQDRADAIRSQRLARGAPVDGKGLSEPESDVPLDRWTAASDVRDFPFTWLPDKPRDLSLLPSPLDSWAIAEYEPSKLVIDLTDRHNARAEAMRLYNSTPLGPTEIAAMVGMPRATVQRWCQQAKRIKQGHSPFL
jgi:hypothetical protein